jgi:gamma-glutamyltranspeptidase/glutathione hydrolase
MSERFGKLPFKALFEPAVYYAEQGYGVSPITARTGRVPNKNIKVPEFAHTFLPTGALPGGDYVRCQAMAQTLQDIAETKGESFYRGRLAQKIADYAKLQADC